VFALIERNIKSNGLDYEMLGNPERTLIEDLPVRHVPVARTCGVEDEQQHRYE
jgi:hypothetical protein